MKSACLYPLALARQFLGISAAMFMLGQTAPAQLFQNLQALSNTLPVGSGARDPDGNRIDGPRWVCTGDFDNDSHADAAVCHLNGEITVLYGVGNGTFTSVTIQSGTSSLRCIVSADFDGDGRDDLAAAAPYDAKVVILLAAPQRAWQAPRFLTSFHNARNLAQGDFDGDGIPDLAAAGPDEIMGNGQNPNQPVHGMVHFRGTGGGAFVRMGTAPSVGTLRTKNARLAPVYSLQAFRRPGETKDWLGLTHENSSTIWLLQTNAQGILTVVQTLKWWGNGSDANSPYQVDSLKIGTVFAPAASGQMDLISVMQHW